MEPIDTKAEEKQKFSRAFGPYFRTPLTFEATKHGPDVVGQIFRAMSQLREGTPGFVYYWGVGTKPMPGRPEEDFVNYLERFTTTFCEYFGRTAHFEVAILTDTHAGINSIPEEISRSYFADVRKRYERYNRAFEFASNLWRRASKDQEREDLLARGILSSQWKSLEFAGLLEGMASRHYLGSPEKVSLAAKRYYRYNLIERQIVETLYPECFFVSWNSPELDPLFPNAMPILHLHVDARETDAEKPWFAEND